MRSAMSFIFGILLMAVAPAVQPAQVHPGALRAARSLEKRSAQKEKAPAPAPAVAPENAPEQSAASENPAVRRDPFESLVNIQKNKGKGANLPPGIAGLQVNTLRLDGIVKAPNGMIAVVTNPQSRTYFLREGDQLYDGKVDKISMDSVTFHEEGKDAFGRAVERDVSKRIYSSAGEQQ
jgi:type IV pilus assembly protein PilP